MDEIIVRLARTLACEERLRVLSQLIARGEITPTDLGRRLQIAPNALSAHLARLTSVGLMSRRRSGARVHCVARSPYDASTLSGMTFAWLRTMLRDAAAPTRRRCGRLDRRRRRSRPTAEIHARVFDAATAFTDVRRLELLRFLRRTEQASATTLCQQLRMSRWALDRHTAKLIRRCYLVSEATDEDVIYRLAGSFKTTVHERLWKIVCAAWDRAQLRTS